MKSTEKRYKSVTEMVHGISDDPEFVESWDKLMKDKNEVFTMLGNLKKNQKRWVLDWVYLYFCVECYNERKDCVCGEYKS